MLDVFGGGGDHIFFIFKFLVPEIYREFIKIYFWYSWKYLAAESSFSTKYLVFYYLKIDKPIKFEKISAIVCTQLHIWGGRPFVFSQSSLCSTQRRGML